jgi:molybdopterin synthase catalytic subunit
MGTAVAHRTSKIFFRDKKLFVYLTSASLREELFNARETIIKRLNEEAGAKVIEEIVFS